MTSPMEQLEALPAFWRGRAWARRHFAQMFTEEGNSARDHEEVAREYENMEDGCDEG